MCTPEALHVDAKLPDGPRVWNRAFVGAVDAALDRVERERQEVTVEIDALREFERRVRAFTPVQVLAGLPGVQALSTRGGTRLSVLRDAYRETVMNTGHYEREYDEPLASNLAAELGPDVASAICDGSDTPLTPQFKQAVVAAVRDARADREVFLAQLDDERESLAEARRTLADVARALPTLSGGADAGRRPGLSTRYEAVERIKAVIAARQCSLHTRSQANRTTGHSLCAYLYGDRATYPVLKSAALLLEALDPHG